ncbi:MAG: CCA tRNA nucleotidyltransferase [Pseudomonadota bacterium]
MTTPVKIEADWLTAPSTTRLVDVLEVERPGAARFVGGCVRNAIMGRPVDDIDLATQLRPDRVMAALERAGIRTVPTGIDHGTVIAIVEGTPFEITTLRRDVETDGRRAIVEFTEDWSEDAARRDFRLNALYAEPNGTLHDPVGGGLSDAMDGQVIFIGDADQRLREDYLRILRFFRFNAWYGRRIDTAGAMACERQKHGLGSIAAERIWKELRKLLAAPDPSLALAAMQDTGILAFVLGDDLGGTHRTARLVSFERDIGEPPDPLRRLLTLIPGNKQWIEDFASRLRLSRRESGRLIAWAEPGLPALGDAASAEVRAGIYRFGAEAVFDRALVEHCRSDTPVKDAFIDAIRNWSPPRFPLTGDDAKGLGLSGAAIGRALKIAEQVWIDSDFTLDKPALMQVLGERL